MKKSDQVIQLAKTRGFFTTSNEIYNPPAGFYDFGPLGVLMKNNLENLWRREVIMKEGFHEVETCLINPEEVFIASGHVATFSDPLTECTKCHKRFRADHIVAEQAKISASGLSLDQLSGLIVEHGLKCPECKGALTKANLFNLMFSTSIGPSQPKTAYMRPESAQGMFVNFKWVLTSVGGSLPMGIAQIGRSFRNEIAPRQGMIRLRELNQAEVEIFMLPEHLNNHPTFSHIEGLTLNLFSKQAQADKKDPTPMKAGEAVKKGIIANQWMAYHLVKSVQLYQRLGVKPENMRCRQHMDTERAHYSKDCWDLEVLTDYGWVEVIGNAYRTDFDLSQHIKLSGADLTVVDSANNKVVPHVVEPSYGIDRMFYVTLEHALRTEGERVWLSLPYEIAPVKAWILPIVKDPALDPISESLKNALIEKGFVAWIMEKASVGKRYARADEAGVPACITLDRQTQQDGTVTIRERDSKRQIRVKASELPEKMAQMLSGADFSSLGEAVTAAPAKE